jgi:hypothetical protein
MKAPALLLATAGLLACSSSGALPATRSGAAAGDAKHSWRNSDDELAGLMRGIAKQLAPVGLVPMRDEFSGFLSTGARGTHAVRVPENRCVTLIALASRAVHDMDAALYSPEGDLLAIDSQPDAHPTIQVCSGATASHLYYALQVYEGAGSFLVAAFEGDAATLEAAAKELGVRPALARLDAPSSDGPNRVAAFKDGLLRRGFEPTLAPLRVPLVKEQRMRVAVGVESGQCYTAAGFALQGVQNVDLRVLDDEGAEVARDESGEEDASAQFCATRKAEFAAEIYGARETGTALLLLFHADAARLGGQSGLWLGERPLTAASTTPLSDALIEVTRRATQDGFKALGASLQGRLAPGEAISHTVALSPKRCARIQAVGGPGVRRLELVAKDAAGQTLAAAEGMAESTYVHVCGTAAREVELQLRASEGAGQFALALYQASLAAVTPAGADERTSADLQQALRQSHDAGYEVHDDFRGGPQQLALCSAGPKLLPIRGAAHCLRAYVISRDPSVRASLLVAGKRTEEAAVLPGVPVRFCAPDASAEHPVELQVSTAAAETDAYVMVLVR